MTIEEIYKEEITKVIRRIRQDPNLKLNFQTGTIGQHTRDDRQARVAVVNATASAALRVQNSELDETGIRFVFENIAMSTPYSGVLRVIGRAISIGTNSNL